MNKPLLRALLPLLLAMLACEPVIAIGQNELLLLCLLGLVLLGPPLYRFLRRVEKSMDQEKKDK